MHLCLLAYVFLHALYCAQRGCLHSECTYVCPSVIYNLQDKVETTHDKEGGGVEKQLLFSFPSSLLCVVLYCVFHVHYHGM